MEAWSRRSEGQLLYYWLGTLDLFGGCGLSAFTPANLFAVSDIWQYIDRKVMAMHITSAHGYIHIIATKDKYYTNTYIVACQSQTIGSAVKYQTFHKYMPENYIQIFKSAKKLRNKLLRSHSIEKNKTHALLPATPLTALFPDENCPHPFIGHLTCTRKIKPIPKKFKKKSNATKKKQNFALKKTSKPSSNQPHNNALNKHHLLNLSIQYEDYYIHTPTQPHPTPYLVTELGILYQNQKFTQNNLIPNTIKPPLNQKIIQKITKHIQNKNKCNIEPTSITIRSTFQQASRDDLGIINTHYAIAKCNNYTQKPTWHAAKYQEIYRKPKLSKKLLNSYNMNLKQTNYCCHPYTHMNRRIEKLNLYLPSYNFFFTQQHQSSIVQKLTVDESVEKVNSLITHHFQRAGPARPDSYRIESVSLEKEARRLDRYFSLDGGAFGEDEARRWLERTLMHSRPIQLLPGSCAEEQEMRSVDLDDFLWNLYLFREDEEEEEYDVYLGARRVGTAASEEHVVEDSDAEKFTPLEEEEEEGDDGGGGVEDTRLDLKSEGPGFEPRSRYYDSEWSRRVSAVEVDNGGGVGPGFESGSSGSTSSILDYSFTDVSYDLSVYFVRSGSRFSSSDFQCEAEYNRVVSRQLESNQDLSSVMNILDGNADSGAWFVPVGGVFPKDSDAIDIFLHDFHNKVRNITLSVTSNLKFSALDHAPNDFIWLNNDPESDDAIENILANLDDPATAASEEEEKEAADNSLITGVLLAGFCVFCFLVVLHCVARLCVKKKKGGNATTSGVGPLSSCSGKKRASSDVILGVRFYEDTKVVGSTTASSSLLLYDEGPNISVDERRSRIIEFLNKA